MSFVVDNLKDGIRIAVWEMVDMLDLAIIIVNYNVEALLRRCLASVYASEGDIEYAVCVVDNVSQDGSVAMVRKEFPQTFLIANEMNVGYPVANNQGMEAFGVMGERAPRYTLLLNPDTEVPVDGLAKMVAYMDANPGVGVVGPKLVLPTGELDAACRRGFPTPFASFCYMLKLDRLFPKSERVGRYHMTFLDEDELAEVDAVVGAFMLVRTSVIQEVGMLDDHFWMYGEDLDWAKRIKDAGWRVMYNPEVEVLHVKRASSKQNPRAQFEFSRAFLIFYYKHYYTETPVWLHPLILLGIGVKGGRAIWPSIRLGAGILEEAEAQRVVPVVDLDIPAELSKQIR
ncbi:MAG TPA: glycosyltransferase family 2 protein [Anaerolineae bacterium]|nr:glycosyltransferase family 2 protein [Anaerolineae bacterium]